MLKIMKAVPAILALLVCSSSALDRAKFEREFNEFFATYGSDQPVEMETIEPRFNKVFDDNAAMNWCGAVLTKEMALGLGKTHQVVFPEPAQALWRDDHHVIFIQYYLAEKRGGSCVVTERRFMSLELNDAGKAIKMQTTCQNSFGGVIAAMEAGERNCQVPFLDSVQQAQFDLNVARFEAAWDAFARGDFETFQSFHADKRTVNGRVIDASMSKAFQQRCSAVRNVNEIYFKASFNPNVIYLEIQRGTSVVEGPCTASYNKGRTVFRVEFDAQGKIADTETWGEAHINGMKEFLKCCGSSPQARNDEL